LTGAGGFAGYNDLTGVSEYRKLPSAVKFETFNDNRLGFLRLSVTQNALTGQYLTAPKAGSERKPAKQRDELTLNLETHLLE
jgi:hypothetical protein